MSTARKVLDLHGQAVTELARELAALPPGRYVLVPENELDGEGEGSELTDEQRLGLLDALARFDRGEPGVSAEESRRRTRAILDAAQRR